MIEKTMTEKEMKERSIKAIKALYDDLDKKITVANFEKWMKEEKGISPIPKDKFINNEWMEFVSDYNMLGWTDTYEKKMHDYMSNSPDTALGEYIRKTARKSVENYKKENRYPHKYLNSMQMEQFWWIYYLIVKELTEEMYPGIKAWFFWEDRNKKDELMMVWDDYQKDIDDNEADEQL